MAEKKFKNKRIGALAIKLCLLGFHRQPQYNLAKWLHKDELSKDHSNKHAKVDGESPQR
jgi:hypothetical protein